MSTHVTVRAGAAMPEVCVGDFILTHNPHSFFSWVIRFGQRFRYHGALKWAAHWNHAAGVVRLGPTPMIVEMLAGGATLSPLSKYSDREYTVVHVPQTTERAQEAASYWLWLKRTKTDYGFLSIFFDAIALLTHLPVGGGWRGHPVCSASVAAGLGTFQWRSSPANVLPADLAFHFNVHPPAYS